MGKKRLLKTDIEREEGFLYYCAGNPISIFKVEMARGGRKKKKRR